MKKVVFFLLTACLAQNIGATTLSELVLLNDLDKGFVGIIYDKKNDKVFLKIENLNQEFIYQTSLASGLGSNDIGLDRGQLGDTRLAVFERVGQRVFLKQKNTKYLAKSRNKQERRAVEEAFATSVLWAFPIVDSAKEWVLVDASDFLLQDIHGVGQRLQKQQQGEKYLVDKSRSAVYMPRTTSFVDNTELEATVTLVGKQAGNFVKQVVPEPTVISLKMHHSFIRLPAKGYQPRTYYPKSGYWSIDYQDYAQPINKSLTQRFIARHRLNKKNPSSKLSEAVKPIIYYLDPGTPEPVKTALIEGALWWNSAFEALGYKNAFQVKMLPAKADPMDVRYNVIQWVHRATRGWSYGSSVVDPRTGEIIKGHVTLGSLRIRQDYLIAQGMLSPFAKDENDQVLMNFALARIRQLAAHEVGHTLGLNHNFAGSHYGGGSVMDYPHPQFQLKENKISANNPYGVGLGVWDKAAIVYGYKKFKEGKENAWLKQSITQNDSQGLLYISDPDARNPGSPHAFASLWDNGTNAVKELEQVNKIRQVALNNFGSRNLKRDRPWSDLQEILVPVYYFHRYQLTAVAKWLGGLEYDYAIKRNDRPATQKVVSGEDQNSALKLMLSTLTPEFLQLPQKLSAMLVPKAVEYSKTRESVKGFTGVAFDPIALAEASAQHTLGLIFHPQRLARLVEQSAIDPTIPSIESMTMEIHQSIIEKNYNGIQAPIHQSVVNLIYSNYLNLLHNSAVSQQVKMQILGVLLKEREYVLRKLTAIRKSSSYYGFYAYQAKRFENLSLENKDKLIQLPKMPPGSPI